MTVVKLDYEVIPNETDCCILAIGIDDKPINKISFNLEYLFEWVEDRHYEWFLHHVISKQYSIDYDFEFEISGSFDEFIGKLKKIYLTKQ